MFARIGHALFLIFTFVILASCTDINPEVSCIASCNEAKTFEYSQQDGSLNFKGIFIENSDVRLYEDGVEIPVQPTFGANTLKIVPIANSPRQLKSASLYKLMLSNAVANGTSTFTLPANSNPGGTTTTITLSGDVSGDSSTTSVDKIKGVPVSATAPTAGNFLKYNGTAWTSSSVAISDISGLSSDLNSKIDKSQIPTCSADETLKFTSPSGTFSCLAIAISDSQISYANQTAKTFLAAPAAAAGAPTFRALAMADLPSSLVSSQWTTNGSDIHFSSGKVGIGTASPSVALHVIGQIQITGGNPAAGKVLTSDSVGQATWTTPPTGLWTAASGSDIYYNAGKVGIGNANPSKQLHVAGDASIGGLNVGQGLNTTSRNTILGKSSMQNEVTGSSSDNTAIGYKTLLNNGGGQGNTAIGSESMIANDSGTGNTAIGTGTMHSVISGNNNVAIGYQSLSYLLTGSNNVGLGYGAGSGLLAQSNVVVIGGNDGVGLSSGMISISNGAGIERIRVDSSGNVGIDTGLPLYKFYVNGTAGGTSAYVNASDIKLKRDIATIPNALEKVQQLRGVSYHWRNDEFPKMNLGKKEELGVIAQEVEAVFPQAVSTASDIKSVAYTMLIGPIIEAIKELAGSKADKTEVEKLKIENAELKARLDRLEKSILKK